jgi:hypothetical protein
MSQKNITMFAKSKTALPGISAGLHICSDTCKYLPIHIPIFLLRLNFGSSFSKRKGVILAQYYCMDTLLFKYLIVMDQLELVLLLEQVAVFIECIESAIVAVVWVFMILFPPIGRVSLRYDRFCFLQAFFQDFTEL